MRLCRYVGVGGILGLPAQDPDVPVPEVEQMLDCHLPDAPLSMRTAG